MPGALSPTDTACGDRIAAQKPPQVVTEIRRREVAPPRFLGHRLQANRLQIARDLVVQRARRARFVVEHLVQQHSTAAAERKLAAQQLVQHHPQAVDVTAAIDARVIAGGLFGRHIGRCPQHLAVERDGDLPFIPPGQPEVCQERRVLRVERGTDAGPTTHPPTTHPSTSSPSTTHPSTNGQQNVAGLDVAVDDPMLVRVVERVGQLRHQLGRFAEGGPATADQVGQRQPGDVVAHDVRRSMLVGDLIHLHDARMAQAGRAAGLAQKPLFIFGCGEIIGAGNLQGHEAIELGIVGFVHLAERAPPEQLQDQEAADRASRSDVAVRGGGAGLEAKRATAVDARHLLGVRLDQLDAVAAVRTLQPLRAFGEHTWAANLFGVLSGAEQPFDERQSPLEGLAKVGVRRQHVRRVGSLARLQAGQELFGDGFNPPLAVVVCGAWQVGHSKGSNSRSRKRRPAW
ncbi:MAG TPA: hypothetical protein VND64_00500 [Pirellulales bacterium]|nr:hypothetical protein [Pirellulales bacterium]